MSYYGNNQRRRSNFSGMKIRLIIAVAIVLFSVVSYMSNTDVNQVTGESQRVGSMTPEQEVMLGLRAAPEMAQQHGGLSRDDYARREVATMGKRLVEVLRVSLERQDRTIPYPFDFHLLADDRVVNAFALPGGQVFITEALFRALGNSPQDRAGRLAGVLGHEIGHVLERHGAEQMAKGNLTQGIVSAAGVAGGSQGSAQLAALVGNVITMKYGREAELESDRWGILLMVLAGFDPNHLLTVMDILEQSSGGGSTPEFMSTHPLPENRREHINRIIADKFPDGLPPGLR